MNRRDIPREDPRGRSRTAERSQSHFTDSRSGGRTQYPRHQQTPQYWQDGNYYQPNTYRSNFQYQNSSSSYNHNSTWSQGQSYDQQWGGYNQSYHTPQWRSPNQHHLSPQRFTAHSQLPTHLTHQISPNQYHQSGVTASTKTSKSSASRENPPLGSKEDRERALEESKDRLKKSLRESQHKSSHFEKKNDISVVDGKLSTVKSNSTKPKPRTTLARTGRESSPTDNKEVDLNLQSNKQTQPRRSSLESNNPICSDSITQSKPTTPVHRRSRSTSLSSSTSGSTSASHSLHSPITSKGQSCKEVQATKQRVIKELLSMSRVKLREIVSYPRSRKIDMVMKYMIKESRTQQSYKQRQLAQAGMEGTLPEGSNTLAQQDVEALLCDPDLHISLSNLPPEMIETLGNIFQLNSTECNENLDLDLGLVETSEGVGQVSVSEIGSNDLSNYSDPGELGIPFKTEIDNTNQGGMLGPHEMKHIVNLSPPHLKTPDYSHTGPTLDCEIVSNVPSMSLVVQTDCPIVTTGASEPLSPELVGDIFMAPKAVEEIPALLQSFELSSEEFSVVKPESVEGVGLLLESVSANVNPFLVEPVEEHPLDSTFKNANYLAAKCMEGTFPTPKPTDEISVMPKPVPKMTEGTTEIAENIHLAADFPQQFSVSSACTKNVSVFPVEGSEDMSVALDSQEQLCTRLKTCELSESVCLVGLLPEDTEDNHMISKLAENCSSGSRPISAHSEKNTSPEPSTKALVASECSESNYPTLELPEKSIVASESSAQAFLTPEHLESSSLEFSMVDLHCEKNIVAPERTQNCVPPEHSESSSLECALVHSETKSVSPELSSQAFVMPEHSECSSVGLVSVHLDIDALPPEPSAKASVTFEHSENIFLESIPVLSEKNILSPEPTQIFETSEYSASRRHGLETSQEHVLAANPSKEFGQACDIMEHKQISEDHVPSKEISLKCSPLEEISMLPGLSDENSRVPVFEAMETHSDTFKPYSGISVVHDSEKEIAVSNGLLGLVQTTTNLNLLDSCEYESTPETEKKGVTSCQDPVLPQCKSPDAIFTEHELSDNSDVEEKLASVPRTEFIEEESNAIIEITHRPTDPMCILYESLDLIGSTKSDRSPKSLDVISTNNDISEHAQDLGQVGEEATEPVTLASDLGSIVVNDVTNVTQSNQRQEEFLTEIESTHVKSEREDVEVEPILRDHNMPHNLDASQNSACTEVSTQTEHTSNTQLNIIDVLKLLEVSCQNSSQEAAFNQLKELFTATTVTANAPQSPVQHQQVRSVRKKSSKSQLLHKPSQKLNRPTTAVTNTQDFEGQFCEISLPNNLNDPILDRPTSEDATSSQEKLKSLFHNITLIENKIETWMEMKKKLYEKVNHILEDEKSQCSSSSEQMDSIVQVTSSSTEQTSMSFPKPPGQSSRQVKKDAPPNKSRNTKDVSKSSSMLGPVVSFPPKPCRGVKKMSFSIGRPVNEEVDNSDICLSKVKKEVLSSTDAHFPVVNKSTLKRKRTCRQKKTIVKPTAQVGLPLGSDTSLAISPPTRSGRNKFKSGMKVDKELLTNMSEERTPGGLASTPRNRRRKGDKELTIPTNTSDESSPRNSRRTIDKESPVPTNSSDDSLPRIRCKRSEKELQSRTSDESSTRNSRRATRSRRADVDEETIELCVLPPCLSRRTKGERKEILPSNELQNVQCMADESSSPRRATRQSIGEPLHQELLFPEVKKAHKRKACEIENADKPEPVKLLNVIRGCSVVLEPLTSHINKISKCSTMLEDHDQSSDCMGEGAEEPLVGSVNKNQISGPKLGVPPVSIVLSSDDDDDLPLLKIKQYGTALSMIPVSNVLTKLKNDADQHSVSSSDTAQDLGIDDVETESECNPRHKKSKPKKSKKEKPCDHHSRNENLEFVDHHRGVILDIKVVGRHVLAASEDGCVYSYSIKSGKLKKKYEGHQAAVTCLCVIDGEQEAEKSHPEKVVTGSLDDHTRCFLFKTAELINMPLKIGTALCVDHNWGIVYLGTKLGEVAKVSSKTFTLIGEHMKFSTESILALKATKEGPRRVLVVGTRDQAIAIRDADTGLFLRSVSGEWHHTACSLLLDKSLVYCGTMSGPIHVFDFTNGREVFQLHAGVGVRCMKIYNNLLFAGCYDSNIYIYNIKDQSLITTITGSGKMVLCLDIAKNKIIYSSKEALQALNFPPEVSKTLKDAKLK